MNKEEERKGRERKEGVEDVIDVRRRRMSKYFNMGILVISLLLMAIYVFLVNKVTSIYLYETKDYHVN